MRLKEILIIGFISFILSAFIYAIFRQQLDKYLNDKDKNLEKYMTKAMTYTAIFLFIILLYIEFGWNIIDF